IASTSSRISRRSQRRCQSSSSHQNPRPPQVNAKARGQCPWRKTVIKMTSNRVAVVRTVNVQSFCLCHFLRGGVTMIARGASRIGATYKIKVFLLMRRGQKQERTKKWDKEYA